MRIALTHPTRWPYVRRGAERFMADLYQYLSLHGYEVVSLAGDSSPQKMPGWLPQRFRDLTGYSFILPLRSALMRERFDLVQSLHFTDACAATSASKRRGYRSCLYMTGPPIPAALRRIPPDRYLVRRAIQSVDKVLAPSQYVGDIVERFYGVKTQILPVPIDIQRFTPGPEVPVPIPTILSVAAFDDRRKGVRPLLRAFVALKRRVTNLRLILSGQMTAELRHELESLLPDSVRNDVTFAGVGNLEDLPGLYRQATVTVLPSKWESYSMVLLESWACGCPVVAADHGALPELVTDSRIGRLFSPGGEGVEVEDIDALTAAIESALELRSVPGVSELCRAKAEQYSWERLGPSFEKVYRDLVSQREFPVS